MVDPRKQRGSAPRAERMRLAEQSMDQLSVSARLRMAELRARREEAERLLRRDREAERQLVYDLRAEGVTAGQIAVGLGRSYDTIASVFRANPDAGGDDTKDL